jgi:predicted MPP superfamily phosphohydrolase
VTWILAAFAVVVLGGLAWGHFEAGWVRLTTLDVPLERLPPELDGLRIVHLADFHLGVPSRGERAVERAVEWTVERDPDLVLVSGDLLSRPGGEARLRELVGRLPRCVAILGNHDFAESTRDPFSQPVVLRDLQPAQLLLDEEVELELRGKRVQIVGVDPRSYLARTSRPDKRVDPTADLRILLCHYPYIIDRLPPGSFDLVLAGHLHDGQICIPFPGGKVRLAHLNWRYTKGLYRRPGGVMHLSPGLGTTFVPFRFCARPEATELRLHSGG